MRIGIDLGGTNIVVGIVTNEGKILIKKSTPTLVTRGAAIIIDDMVKLIYKTLDVSHISMEDIELIGIGVPGLVDYKSGLIKECVNLGWGNVDICTILKEKTGKKIFIDNDANAAAGAEFLFGTMKNHLNSVFLTLGTGVGGGIILNGKLHRGINGSGAEIGHMIVGENFYDCACGNNGCLETFTSATALIKFAKKLIKEDPQDTLILKNTVFDEIDAKIIFDCAKQGDKLANLVVERFVKYFAIGICNIVNILDVSMIGIGGGVSAAGEFFMELLISDIKKYKLFKEIPVCYIKIADLGNDAGIIGAAMLDIL
ncbi:ROK family protein [Clostridium bowmanii]|uniref:ROK family protein n=1 Tax=Clostridium bowmanii TaxID=132925 RepID=UPI001C0BF534|nr:ROK family protein [Clostridium bowmanii]MBU3188666.1 ROK family protein [Clostridium bowmanii]MCA1073251.1 ROK family protein [Clostridium bowmanii]